jgi:hypothetical protein
LPRGWTGPPRLQRRDATLRTGGPPGGPAQPVSGRQQPNTRAGFSRAHMHASLPSPASGSAAGMGPIQPRSASAGETISASHAHRDAATVLVRGREPRTSHARATPLRRETHSDR